MQAYANCQPSKWDGCYLALKWSFDISSLTRLNKKDQSIKSWTMKKSHATKLWLLQIFYASCYIALVFSLIVQVSQCIKKFTDGSTYYDSSVVRQKKTLFPDITVCGNMFGLKEAKLKVKIFSQWVTGTFFMDIGLSLS